MKTTFIWIYAIAAYLMAFSTLVAFALFTVGVALPFTADQGGVNLGVNPWIVNTILIALFGVQHSVMARPTFKAWLGKIIPQPLERTTYLVASSAPLILLIVFWQSMSGVVWQSTSPTLEMMGFFFAAMGWFLVVVSTFLISHFDLFGLRQVYFYCKNEPCPPISFATPSLYRWVRHPMQLGVVLGVWPAATMTTGHFFLAAGMSVYILVGLYFEERDLVAAFGQRYRAYQASVPKLLPFSFRSRTSRTSATKTN